MTEFNTNHLDPVTNKLIDMFAGQDKEKIKSHIENLTHAQRKELLSVINQEKTDPSNEGVDRLQKIADQMVVTRTKKPIESVVKKIGISTGIIKTTKESVTDTVFEFLKNVDTPERTQARIRDVFSGAKTPKDLQKAFEGLCKTCKNFANSPDVVKTLEAELTTKLNDWVETADPSELVDLVKTMPGILAEHLPSAVDAEEVVANLSMHLIMSTHSSYDVDRKGDMIVTQKPIKVYEEQWKSLIVAWKKAGILEKMESLQLSDIPPIPPSALCLLIKACSNLTHFSAGASYAKNYLGIDQGNIDNSVLKALEGCKNLKELNLGTGVGDRVLQTDNVIRLATKCNKLQKINIIGRNGVHIDELMEGFNKLRAKGKLEGLKMVMYAGYNGSLEGDHLKKPYIIEGIEYIRR